MNAEIEELIRKNVPWGSLPAHIKQILNNTSKNYERCVVSFSIKNQLRYRGNLVRYIVRDEKRYYERVVAYSKERLMLFPYHLADMIVKGLRITPFNYYISVVEKLMQAERSYDTLPNFTAADCLRLLGIGRNEYIDIMNKSRSSRGRLFGKVNLKGLLPTIPCDLHIEPWWRVEVGMVLEEDVKMVNEEELVVIDKLIDLGSQTAGELSFNVVLSLYKKGLIYLDVPITAEDCIQVPPLQGFVMNRVLGDYFETLLYKIFVSIDEHTTVGELAGVLQVDKESVKQAVSLYCRLQFAKKIEPETGKDRSRRHISWNFLQTRESRSSFEVTPLTMSLSKDNLINFSQNIPLSPCQSELLESPAGTTTKKGQRVAFLFDSTLTAFLMMGNLSPGLKKHAVTMFEVGKLSDESLDSFIAELEKVSVLDAEGEGEARRFFDHAVILRSTILALRKLAAPGLDLVRLESLHSLDEPTCSRLLQKKYNLLVSMAPLNREVKPVMSLNPPHLGPAVPEVNSLWFKLFLYHITGYGPPSLLLTKGTEIKQLPRLFLGYSRLLVTTWLHEPAVIPVSNILHVNMAAKYSHVLVQAYGVHKPADIQIIPFPFRPDTPSKITKKLTDFDSNSLVNDGQFKGHPAVKYLSELIDLEHNCGYLTFADVGVRDFGCLNREPTVKLGRSQKHLTLGEASRTSSGPEKSKKDQILSIANDNFSFSSRSNNDRDCTKSKDLHSLDESHFALTPLSNSQPSSPRNGFTSHECSELLRQELDKLDLKEVVQSEETRERLTEDSLVNGLHLKYSTSLDAMVMSPIDENISMFSRDEGNNVDLTDHENKGEVWTLLDCHFGVPLFDVNANTKICNTIVSGGLADPKSLENLVESSRKLGSSLLDFISQCQYRAGENMEIMKRGKLIPLPRHCLIFDNGKISEWSGK